jgi:hypothetical protein
MGNFVHVLLIPQLSGTLSLRLLILRITNLKYFCINALITIPWDYEKSACGADGTGYCLQVEGPNCCFVSVLATRALFSRPYSC